MILMSDQEYASEKKTSHNYDSQGTGSNKYASGHVLPSSTGSEGRNTIQHTPREKKGKPVKIKK